MPRPGSSPPVPSVPPRQISHCTRQPAGTLPFFPLAHIPLYGLCRRTDPPLSPSSSHRHRPGCPLCLPVGWHGKSCLKSLRSPPAPSGAAPRLPWAFGACGNCHLQKNNPPPAVPVPPGAPHTGSFPGAYSLLPGPRLPETLPHVRRIQNPPGFPHPLKGHSQPFPGLPPYYGRENTPLGSVKAVPAPWCRLSPLFGNPARPPQGLSLSAHTAPGCPVPG